MAVRLRSNVAYLCGEELYMQYKYHYQYKVYVYKLTESSECLFVACGVVRPVRPRCRGQWHCQVPVLSNHFWGWLEQQGWRYGQCKEYGGVDGMAYTIYMYVSSWSPWKAVDLPLLWFLLPIVHHMTHHGCHVGGVVGGNSEEPSAKVKLLKDIDEHIRQIFTCMWSIDGLKADQDIEKG